MAGTSKGSLPVTLSFEQFWTWLQAHPNCVVRCGTPETSLVDDDDYHWHFGVEPDGTYLVEMIRGKRLVGDLAIPPGSVTYVQGGPGETDKEYVFDLFADPKSTEAVYYFVLSHGYDAEEGGRLVH